jgi:hypothetical protein
MGVQTWELWYPAAAATGLEFARGRLDPTEVLWVHAAPERLAVTVREGDDRVIARGEPLEGGRWGRMKMPYDDHVVAAAPFGG